MTQFIPEWTRVNAQWLRIHQVLAALGDTYVVRRPLVRPSAAHAFIEHPTAGWLALAVDNTPYAQIDPDALIEPEQRHAFEQRLTQWRDQHSTPHALELLVLLWACSTEEVRALSRVVLPRFGVRLLSRAQFEQIGARMIRGLASPLAPAAVQALRHTYFPETEIAAVHTQTCRIDPGNRDNQPTLFLDATQEWASNLDLDLEAAPSPEQTAHIRDFSVRLINGVAGSGKTLIALHRGLLLSELFPQQQVLMLIHNTPVVADLHARLRHVYGQAPPQLHISTFFAWACRQWRGVFGAYPRMPPHPQFVHTLMESLRVSPADLGLRLTAPQLLEEFDFINDTLIAHQSAYLDAPRSGRGFALRRTERVAVWLLYEQLTEALRARGLRLWSALAHELCLAPTTPLHLGQHHHILIDEAQFFSPAWFRLVQHALQPGGQLFICADPNQGFLKRGLSWKSAGLDVAGRTKTLRHSYRTQRPILEAAHQVLTLAGCSNACDEPDGDFLTPDFARMSPSSPHARPRLIYVDSPQDALDRAVNEINALHQHAHLPLGSVLVLYGERINRVDLYRSLVRQLGGRHVWWLNEKSQRRAPAHGSSARPLRMAYIDSATGLEAAVVFVLGAEKLLATLSTDSPPEEDARKLYMAMTRASARLVLLSTQRLPAALERWFDPPDLRSHAPHTPHTPA